MSIHRKKSKKSHDIRTWIRQRTSQTCYGVKTIDGNPAHCNKNNDVLMFFRALRAGYWSHRLSRLSNADLADHFAGRKTFYFTADGRSATSEVLVNIDIDCHYSGSLGGALAFADHLRATRFPGLYFETSTNGNGVHGYFVVVKGDQGDEGLNTVLGRLDRWLKHELSKGNWDVEDVEVKGQAPEFTWGREKYELKTYKSGQLAKLPREALKRGDELRGTTRIAVDDLRRLRLPSDAIEFRATGVRPVNKAVKEAVASHEVRKPVSGSIAGRHFGTEELAGLDDRYLRIATDLLGGKNLVATGRKVVTGEDLAGFLMMLKFFTKNMNVDGTLPTARWKAMWDALYEAGDVDRAWCHHRYAAMRNFLSGKDLLSWEAEGYVIGSEIHGRYIPGTAAKWRASEELMTMLVGQEASQGGGERGESILYGCIELLAASETSEAIEFVTDFESDRSEEAGGEGESTLYGCIIPFKIAVPKTTGQSHHAEPPFLARLRAEISIRRPRFVGYSWQREGFRLAA